MMSIKPVRDQFPAVSLEKPIAWKRETNRDIGKEHSNEFLNYPDGIPEDQIVPVGKEEAKRSQTYPEMNGFMNMVSGYCANASKGRIYPWNPEVVTNDPLTGVGGYMKFESILYNDVIYLSKVDNNLDNPAISLDNWIPLSTLPSNISLFVNSEWDPTLTYKAGDKLFHAKNTWVCLAANTNKEPNFINLDFWAPATYSYYDKEEVSLVFGDGAIVGSESIAIGHNSKAELKSISIGDGAIANLLGTSLGNGAIAGHTSVALGLGSHADDLSIAIGIQAISRDGTLKIAIGYEAEASGDRSIAIGHKPLASQDSIAIGGGAIASVNFGIAIGAGASIHITDGIDPASSGMALGHGATSVGSNIAIGNGAQAPYRSYNSHGMAIGDNAYCRGLSSLAFGHNAYNATNLSVAIGCDAGMADAVLDYQILLGGYGTTPWAYAHLQLHSDIRDKAEIRNTILGLDFINKLRPVDYKWDMRGAYLLKDQDGKVIKDKNGQGARFPSDGSKIGKRFHHGFISQDIQKLIQDTGVDFSGLQDTKINFPEHENDRLTLGYTEFIAPMVKAIQELSATIEDLNKRIQILESK